MNTLLSSTGTDHAVQETPEFERVFGLPRRDWEQAIQLNELYKRITAAFRLPNGRQELRLIQAAALADAHDQRGLLAPIAVGHGKTLVSFLLPTVVLNIQRPTLLIPAALVEKTWREFRELQRHWLCHPAFSTRARFDEAVITYEKLGRDSGKDGLMARRPDMLIADECFIGETLIQTPKGSRRIETLRAGDQVFDACGEKVFVEAAWSTPANEILELVLGEHKLYCTPNHPFLTTRGWVRADALTEKDDVFQAEPALLLVQKEADTINEESVLLKKLLFDVAYDATRDPREAVQQNSDREDQREVVGLSCGAPYTGETHSLSPDARIEPNVRSRDPQEGLFEGEEACESRCDSEATRRQRLRHAETPTAPSGCVRLGDRAYDCDGPRRGASLHDRHRKQTQQSGSGGRWRESQTPLSTESRSREGLLPPRARLVRVSSVERRGSLSNSFDGKVYNLQVGGSHTYLVGAGFVVHNCHKLRNLKTAACAKRVDRYMLANPETVFCGMSGTITKRSIRDYWHLLRWALRDRMPLPRTEAEMERWAEALDERRVDVLSRRDPGALMKLCTDEERDRVNPKRTAPLGRTDQMPSFFGNLGEKLVVSRQGYHRRLRDTPGVICSSDKEIDCSLVIKKQVFDPGPKVAVMLEKLRQDNETPNGDLLATPADVWRQARELACGFYYRWVPPPPPEWLVARKKWNWIVRQILTPPDMRNRRQVVREQGVQALQMDGSMFEQYRPLHLDSPMQVALAVQQERITDHYIVECYRAWEKIRGSYTINTVAQWVDDGTLNFCEQWVKSNGSAIIWTEHRAFGERLAAQLKTGFCLNGGLDAAGKSIEEYAGKTVVASVAANKEGRNLQAWHRNLIVTMSPTGSLWQQAIGRTHRMGQPEDTVYVDWLCACSEQEEGFQQLMADAKYIQDTTGQNQKLLYADHI